MMRRHLLATVGRGRWLSPSPSCYVASDKRVGVQRIGSASSIASINSGYGSFAKSNYDYDYYTCQPCATRHLSSTTATATASSNTSTNTDSSTRNTISYDRLTHKDQAVLAEARDLMHQTRDFVKTHPPSDPTIENATSMLFNSWSKVLYEIPLSQHHFLNHCAESLDQLAHLLLEYDAIHNTSNTTSQAYHARHIATACSAWGRTSSKDNLAAIMSEQLLEKWQNLSVNIDTKTQQDLYGAVIQAFSQSPAPDAAGRAKHWLDQLVQKSTHDSTVDDRAYHAVVRAYAKQGQIDIVQTLLKELPIQNSVYSYGNLILAWLSSRHPDASEHATKALQECLQSDITDEEHAKALVQLCATFLNHHRDHPPMCHQIVNQLETLQEKYPVFHILEPRHIVIAMTAWAKIGRPDKVQELATWMQGIYERSEDERFQPNYQVSVIALSAYTKKPTLEALQQSESILEKIEELFFRTHESRHTGEGSINNHAYNLVLHAYSSNPMLQDRVPRINQMLHRMRQMAQETGNNQLLPDRISFTSLIRALAKDKRVRLFKEIDSILRMMANSQREELRPDAKIVSLVLDIYANSKHPSGISRAFKLVEDIKLWNVSIEDEVTNTILMKLYTNAGNPYKSRDILNKLRDDFKKTGNIMVRPTRVAYLTAIRGFSLRQVPDSSDSAYATMEDMIEDYRTFNKSCSPFLRIFQEVLFILSRNRNPDVQVLKMAKAILAHVLELNLVPQIKFWNSYIAACGRERHDKVEAWNEMQDVFERLRGSQTSVDSASYLLMLQACKRLVEDESERSTAIQTLVAQCQKDGLSDKRIDGYLRDVVAAAANDQSIPATEDTTQTVKDDGTIKEV